MSGRRGERAVAIVSCEYAPFPGGIACYATQIAKQLQDAGVPLTAIVPHYPDLPAPADPPRVHRLLRHHRIAVRAALSTMRVLAAQPPNAIILAADIRSVFLVALWARLTRRPYRVMVHGSEAMKFSGRSIIGSFARSAYRRADTILANSQATMDIFEQSFGPAPRGRVVHLGVDPVWFSPPATETFANAALAALPDEARIVCSVGRIESRKGQLEAVLALADAQTLGSGPLCYVIAGRIEDSDYAARIIEAGETRGVRIVMPGRLDEQDIRLLYRRSIGHLLCARNLPTKIEGFGLVLLEAGAQRCPSITTRVGGIPEVVGEDSPLLFDSEDKSGPARAIRNLARDAVFRESQGARAFERARFFSWTRCARLSFPELQLDPDNGPACRPDGEQQDIEPK